jgi:hypothetical protein
LSKKKKQIGEIMKSSEKTGLLTGALLAFKANVTSITKSAKNPFHGSEYATLDQILDTIKPLLVAVELDIMQAILDGNKLYTRIEHISGEFRECTMDLLLDDNTKQSASQRLGSAVTYSRRYQLGAILGLSFDKDTDANPAPRKDDRPWLNESDDAFEKVKGALTSGKYTVEQVEKKYKLSKAMKDTLVGLCAG